MIMKWASGFPVDCDSACIISGISGLSFSASVKRITSLNDIGRTYNIASPVTVVVVAVDGFMVLVVAVALT